MKDNVVIRFLNKVTDLVVLNLLFVLCSLPVITMGASMTAMMSVSLRSVEYGDGYVVKTFFRSFKESWKQATEAWIVNLLLFVMVFLDLQFWSKFIVQNIMTKTMLVLSVGLGLFVLMIFLWVYPLISKTKGTLYEQFRNAAAMAIGYFFPYTIACIAVVVAIALMSYVNLGFALSMFIVGFAVVSYILAFFFHRVFEKHMEM